MIHLDKEMIPLLHKGKNLLAFSAGVDSSALFFLLLQENIAFDIALVNYGLRENSIKEETYAQSLAEQYNLQCYSINAPSFTNNFEKNARDFRYAFFHKLIDKHHYNNLLTAHQLNDQLEWFLMRLTKGAGTNELLGLEGISTRQNYTLLRPLLHLSKDELLNYLQENQYKYFVDESNFSEKYERNRFRKKFSDELISNYKKGIERSFKYLKEDKEILQHGYKELFQEKEFYLLSYNSLHLKIRLIDQYLKKLGYLLSGEQRKTLEKEDSLVIGGKWAIEIETDKIYIAPYFQGESMPKKFKEKCRLLHIPIKIRAYLYKEEIDLIKLSSLM